MIDDEKPALLQLERLLEADGRIQVEGKFISAQAGLEHLERHGASIVFLDIDMPEMNGLEAAERIQQINGDIRIVYVTAYAHYAVEAFELYALDYLLKPVNPSRFAKTVERLAAAIRHRNVEAETPPQPVKEKRVGCFKRLTLYDDVDTAKHYKWRTTKSQELFAFLIHHKGQWVSKDRLLEALWPNSLQDKAMTHLHTSIYQIRKLMKEWGVRATVEYALDSYRLSAEEIVTDVQLLEAIPVEEAITEHNRERRESILDLYSGDYLEEHDFSWAATKRQELLNRYLSLSLTMAQYELDTGRERLAVQRLLRLQDKEPYSEEICEMLLTAYAKNNNFNALRSHYEFFVRLIRMELDKKPEKLTKDWLERLVHAKKFQK
ncbi:MULTISPECIES: response regulator [unclassified Paenibacillus]|uniref:response regulator n=1 Tax=unclassified Paenibacillus TaxID=185978 RepID=UPI001B6D807A|nr:MULTISPECIES: response regulator [unclassified Paenibacillus]MBP1157329.1 two-component SAPR family response regulator [Paenibacillus sp. PvP091]MBP1171932.1 two-component SAPR family response regulator [Paenibacillus sp. PvR098]MBP2438313.1 two-component SAPR family response regulator [Paenibacillus sp. PvP052]